jgi:phosphoserine phosphatase
MDMDSTLINEEGIDLLADKAGIGSQIAEITASAMAGERDFYSSLEARVALLAGISTDVIPFVRKSLSFTVGAKNLIQELQDRNWIIGVVSGGFHEIIDDFLAPLGLHLIRANRFETAEGRFTGRVLGPIIGPREKASALLELAQIHGIDLEDTVAIGDGANDREMIAAAGLGIAFCAKPALQQVAKVAIEERDLSLVLQHITRP